MEFWFPFSSKTIYCNWSRLPGFKLRLHTAINRADFVSWWMWFNASPTKSTASFSHDCILLTSYVYNMHQDTKLARLIAVCKRSFRNFLNSWKILLTDFLHKLSSVNEVLILNISGMLFIMLLVGVCGSITCSFSLKLVYCLL